ncbi:metallo-beta-lactamase family protein [Diplodia corticola]|uniref:Metallo-beta-lactamase family protein n=1 Tax=Diplodia corticola TaxID=236234 RepID=A0A1J9RJY0_9PEZI|nr:metallo-beta-lactamase family protein [Diplodia corticola]OJD32875.1 metallo-beta-lactamase family protein [Diplodia corticola]
MTDAEDLLICHTCGTQFDVPASKPLPNCRICDDPRQFVPPTGQQWTSMAELRRGKYENKWEQDAEEKDMWSIWTEPKFAIGQRAILIKTPEGNVLWDLITYLDSKTIDFINSHGPLRAIVISHPHYYTTHLEWARAFNNVPVYTSVEDESWFSRADFAPSASASAPSFPVRRLLSQTAEDILPGAVTAVKTGGHFPGSLVLLWKRRLMVADTFVTVPSGLYHHDRPPGTTSYSFMWSIPNMIPLSPPEIHAMWKAIAPYEWESTHGAFRGLDIRRKDCKRAVLESMKIQVKYEGHASHAILSEDC